MLEKATRESEGGGPALFVRRPILAFVVSALIVLAGFAALFGVEIRELPNVDRPVVSVTTQFPGAEPVVTYLANTIAANGREIPYSMVTGTTRTDGAQDTGVVDMGYHYPVPPTPSTVPDITLSGDDITFAPDGGVDYDLVRGDLHNLNFPGGAVDLGAVICLGEDIRWAYDIADLTEELARIAYLTEAIK